MRALLFSVTISIALSLLVVSPTFARGKVPVHHGPTTPYFLVHGPTPLVNGAFSLWLAGSNFGINQTVHVTYQLTASPGQAKTYRQTVVSNAHGGFSTPQLHARISAKAISYTLKIVAVGEHGQQFKVTTAGIVPKKH